VVLLESRVEDGEGGIFAGIDTTLVGLAEALPDTQRAEVVAHLGAYRISLARARDAWGPNPIVLVSELEAALRHLEAAQVGAGEDAPLDFQRELAHKGSLAEQALLSAAGVVFDLRANDDLVVPGQTVEVSAQLWNGGPLRLTQPRVAFDAPEAWATRVTSSEGLSADGHVEPGALATWTYEVTLPDTAALSRLYYLREERDGARYRWPDEPELWGLPRDPAPVSARVGFAAMLPDEPEDSLSLSVAASWRHVSVEPTRGELSRPVLVVPAVGVRVEPSALVWPQSRAQSAAEARAISVVVRAEAEGGASGTVVVDPPAGWAVAPANQPYSLAAAGAERTLAFELRPSGSPAPGEHAFQVVARDAGGAEYREGYRLIDYEHIERAAMFAPAVARVTVVPVMVAEGLRVGYIMGSGDDGPDAIAQLGIDLEMLGEDRVREGDFAGLDAIVLGVRAWEARPDLRAAVEQVHDFARAGGVVVAQYNRESLGSLPPFPLEVGRASPRVTDENAAVTILDPTSPVLTTPNAIGPADFEGWVQERGLYFGEQWDPRWVPLLEMNDAGEPPQRGSLLVARVGDGAFVYTALSFFRQWSAGVPGAYRLFANLMSLDPATWAPAAEAIFD